MLENLSSLDIFSNLELRHEGLFYAVYMCLYVADPATFLASNSVCSSENSLFIYLEINT